MMFEMKSFANGLMQILSLTDYKKLPDKLFEVSINHDVQMLEKIKTYLPDLQRDYLLEVFQFFIADRENKKQDYTPISLSRLLSGIIGKTNSVADVAAGSGTLSQQVLEENDGAGFYAEELDHQAVAFMMINYVLRNKHGLIAEKDALSVSTDRQFRLTSTDEFSIVEEELPIGDSKTYDSVVSNPPYNIPYEIYDNGRFPIKLSSNNANYTFLFRALELLDKKGRAVFILPNEVLTSSHGLNARKYLLEHDLVEAVVMLPAKMFFVTQIPVVVMVLSRNKALPDYVKLIDQRNIYEKTIRKQVGEGNTNSQRVYEKEMAELNSTQINKIVELINNKNEFDEIGYAVTKDNLELLEHECNLTVSRYITPVNETNAHRKLEQIIDDLIRISNEKTRIKFTINKTSAAELGIDDDLAQMLNKSASLADEINDNNASLGLNLKPIPNADKKMVTLTPSKVLKIEVNIKDGYIPEFIKFLMPSWKQLIFHWNEEEIRYLAEYRDALLPLLLSGKLNLEGAQE